MDHYLEKDGIDWIIKDEMEFYGDMKIGRYIYDIIKNRYKGIAIAINRARNMEISLSINNIIYHAIIRETLIYGRSTNVSHFRNNSLNDFLKYYIKLFNVKAQNIFDAMLIIRNEASMCDPFLRNVIYNHWAKWRLPIKAEHKCIPEPRELIKKKYIPGLIKLFTYCI